MKRAGMIDVAALDEFKRTLLDEKQLLIPQVPALERFPPYPANSEVIELDPFDVPYYRYKLFSLAEDAPTVWSIFFHRTWRGHVEDHVYPSLSAFIDEWLFNWRIPRLDGSSARGTFFERFKKRHGKSGRHFSDRVNFRPGTYDAELRNEIAQELGYVTNVQELVDLANLNSDYFNGNTDPAFPLEDIGGHLHIRDIDGQSAAEAWALVVEPRWQAMSDLLDRIRITLDPDEETLSRLFACWQRFHRGSQFPWRGE